MHSAFRVKFRICQLYILRQKIKYCCLFFVSRLTIKLNLIYLNSSKLQSKIMYIQLCYILPIFRYYCSYDYSDFGKSRCLFFVLIELYKSPYLMHTISFVVVTKTMDAG